jgi:shikimate dehydrogenase
MTHTVGLIGWPVEHSRSPAMHNAACEALGLDWRYVLLPTPPDQIELVVNRIRSGELSGANVTIPHKQAVMPLLDELDPAAAAIGAVNTIVPRGDRLIGYNTDVLGFTRSLLETGVEVKDNPCVLLGAGGAARAVVYALRQLGALITLYARDVAKAQSLIGAGAARALTELDQIDRDTVLIVNTTPLGMSPQIEASPWPASLTFPLKALAFDLIYNPVRTHWMMQAERSGNRVINGLPMLIYQGAAAFEMWTGQSAPVDVMRSAIV